MMRWCALLDDEAGLGGRMMTHAMMSFCILLGIDTATWGRDWETIASLFHVMRL